MIEEYNSSNVLQADYVMGRKIDEPLTMTRSSTTYYYHCDGLNSVRQITDSSGTIQESYDYSPYGVTTIFDSTLTDITSTGSGIDNPYMFTGRRYDEESGIYHYRRRAYDPEIGRFLQRDPIGYVDGMNLYEYGLSNPINYTDPFGLQSATEYVLVWTPILVGVYYICTEAGRIAQEIWESVPTWVLQSSSDDGTDSPPEGSDGTSDDGKIKDTYPSLEDATGTYGEELQDVDKTPTKNEGLKDQGFTEKWTGWRESDETWQSGFYNPDTGEFTGGHESSRW